MKLKSFASISHEGPYLKTNEDGHDFDINNELFLLFDGYGGAGIGDTAVNKLKEEIKSFYLRLGEDEDATLPFFYSPKYLLEGNALINSFLFSHDNLMKVNFTKDISERAGASVMGVVKSESILTLVSSGSCLALLYRKGMIQKIMIEDSFELLSSNIHESYLKTMPASGLGLFPDLHYQVKEVRLCEDDIICLLTDGIYSRITLEEIKHILSRPHENQNIKLKELCELANAKGNLDNQSGVILSF